MEIKDERADDRPDRHHGLQAYEAALDEFPGRHRFPAVVVGVTDDEPGQHEEEVDGQVAVVDDLVHMAGGVCFKDMEPHDDNGGHPAQSVKNVVVMFFTSGWDGRVLWVRHRRSCFLMLFLFCFERVSAVSAHSPLRIAPYRGEIIRRRSFRVN